MAFCIGYNSLASRETGLSQRASIFLAPAKGRVAVPRASERLDNGPLTDLWAQPPTNETEE
jgi:hypothetical protein